MPGAGNWAQELPAATESYNELPHDHLQNMDPNQVVGSKDIIFFSLQEDAGNRYAQNDQVVRRREARLEPAGGYREPITSKAQQQRSFKRHYGDEVKVGCHQIPSERCPLGQTLRL